MGEPEVEPGSEVSAIGASQEIGRSGIPAGDEGIDPWHVAPEM